MVARIDKYDGKVGGFRAPLNAAWSATSGPAGVSDLNRVTCVALNGSGNIIRATTVAGVVGVIIVDHAMAAGEPIDVMTSGEIVDLAAADLQAATAPVAGTKYYFDATAGRLTATAPTPAGTNGVLIGTTVEATRLVVRLDNVQA